MASLTARYRAGGWMPRTQPARARALGSFTVTQWRHRSPSRATTRATWSAKRSGEPGISQNSSPSHHGWVKWHSVTTGVRPRSWQPDRMAR